MLKFRNVNQFIKFALFYSGKLAATKRVSLWTNLPAACSLAFTPLRLARFAAFFFTMIEGLLTSENIVHVGALLYLAGFLFRNQLILRSLIIAGDFVYILYFYFAPDVPLWGGIFWSAMFTVVNLAMIGVIVADTMHFSLTANEKKLFGQLENLTPGEFRQLLRAGKEELAAVPAVITRGGETLEKLYFILEGRMTIEKGGQSWPSETQTFIGEIAFLLARPATATVILEAGTVYFVWEAEVLHRLLRGNPALNTALSAIMNKKLAQKVASAGVLVNTIGLDYQVSKT